MPGAAEVANWYASSSGNNSNDGVTSGTSVLDIEEIQYRIGNQSIDGNTVGAMYINLLSNYNDGREYSFNFNLVHSGSVVFLGQKNIAATYTISAVTPWNEATGTVGTYTLTGLPDLTTHVGKFARISVSTNSFSVGRKTPIVDKISAGIFIGSFTDQATTLQAEPIVGDTIQIYSPTKLGGNIIINSSPVVFNSGGGVYFQDIDLGIIDSDHSVTIGSGVALFIACILRGCDVEPGVNMCSLNLCETYNLRCYSSLSLTSTIMQKSTGALLAVRGCNVANTYNRCWAYGGGINIGHSSDGTGNFNTTGTFVISNSGTIGGADAVIITSKSSLITQASFLLINSSGSVNGFHVRPGGGFYYPTAIPPLFFGTLPTTKFRIGSNLSSTLGSGLRDTLSSAEMIPGDT